jgi:hypothetical protein
MDEDRAIVFMEVASLPNHLLAKYGSNYCYVPLLLDQLVALIKSEDYAVREATANLMKEILSG